MNKRNKMIKRNRVKRVLIDEAVLMMEEQPPTSMVIRNLASRVGYNSATIYNYFDDFKHLIFMGCLSFLDEYIKGIAKEVKKDDGPMDIYLKVWKLFAKRAYQYPDVFYHIFFKHYKSTKEEMIEEYYSLYPQDLSKYSENIKEMLSHTELKQRSHILIKPAIEAKVIEEETAMRIDFIVRAMFESLLLRRVGEEIKEKEATEKFITTANEVYKNFTK